MEIVYKVLIVEDEDIIRKGLMFVVDWLKINCVVVGEAVNGVDGLNKIRELGPDIVITDVRMPQKDGIQMLEESIEKYNCEAIIISGYSEFKYAKKAITLGVSEYLLKPIDFEDLYAAVNKIGEKIDSRGQLKCHLDSVQDLELYEGILNVKHYEQVENKTKHVINMLAYIEENYDEKISLTDLNEEYGISTVYLNAKFKEEINYTFNDFLNRYRILKSIELLKEGYLKMYEIADQVGFQDYKYFSQVFRKYIGHSPTQFLNFIETAL